MESLLVLLIAILSIVLIVLTVKYKGLAVKYNKQQEEHHNLELHVQDRANEQYHAWVDAESQHIRTQQLNLARREAAVALAEWKSSSELSIRNDAIHRSQSVILGKVTEHLVPYLPTFSFNPKDARFIGSPIDMLVFDGMDEGELREIVFIEVKTGPTAALTKRERQIRDAVRTGRIQWREVRVERIAT
jgi:predicted Holliday junction resolvase-like endonuclease